MLSITDKWFEQIPTLIVFKIPIPVSWRIASENIKLKTLEGDIDVQIGNIIVKGAVGEEWSMPMSVFEKLYEIVDSKIAIPFSIYKQAKLADHDGKIYTGWGSIMEYKENIDFIIRHGHNDYGVIKKYIFEKTYSIVK